MKNDSKRFSPHFSTHPYQGPERTLYISCPCAAHCRLPEIIMFQRSFAMGLRPQQDCHSK